MLRMGLGLGAVLLPVQLAFGHLVGDYVHRYQPAKFAAIEARWNNEQPAGEVALAIPNEATQNNNYEIKIPLLGSLIASMSFSSKEVGLTNFRSQDRPPVLIPFFAFRVMVGCGLVMLALAWAGSYLAAKDRIEKNRLLLWCIFLSFPLPYVAILTGWFTAEVGRQPWTVYGVLRTADAPEHPCGGDLAHCILHDLQLHVWIRNLLHLPPFAGRARWPLILPPIGAIPNRPMSVVDAHAHIGAHKIIHNDAVEHVLAGE